MAGFYDGDGIGGHPRAEGRVSRYGEPPSMPDIDPAAPRAPLWRPSWWPYWWRHIPRLVERYGEREAQ